jgi:hypothetical protein
MGEWDQNESLGDWLGDVEWIQMAQDRIYHFKVPTSNGHSAKLCSWFSQSYQVK